MGLCQCAVREGHVETLSKMKGHKAQENEHLRKLNEMGKQLSETRQVIAHERQVLMTDDS